MILVPANPNPNDEGTNPDVTPMFSRQGRSTTYQYKAFSHKTGVDGNMKG